MLSYTCTLFMNRAYNAKNVNRTKNDMVFPGCEKHLWHIHRTEPDPISDLSDKGIFTGYAIIPESYRFHLWDPHL